MGKTYTTVQGDMWDGIAYRQLGSVAYTGELMAANKQYRDYYIFPAGVVLELPEAERLPEADTGTLPPWKGGNLRSE